MPTATFFRLEEEKQEKIIRAAKKEFSEVPIHEASIANIIKNAEIPRGSFYQYFTGKEDLFYYLFDFVRKNPEEHFLNCLKEEKGDIFKTFHRFFPLFAKEVFEGEDSLFLRNIFLHMNHKSSVKFMSNEMNEEEKEAHLTHMRNHRKDSIITFKKIMSTIDKEKLKIKMEKEISILFRQLWFMVLNTINEGYRMKCSKEDFILDDLVSEFNMKINWLEHGVSKQ
ncbi:TetR/AcrR family transcriptional regulator [Vagococcus carniphilus]|uniref:TetR/AcrR family transcriptional regulator n=1 Tax=Vagococcus carniphilus TaxID=218144 RepID=UPI002891B2CF|nr:TetR/AcrR family transcriptional regulator [Vagococcus carniphilus]MDT2850063.1 TetR/AcrR family transcriptional regulator [Vagococcus carniphilus]